MSPTQFAGKLAGLAMPARVAAILFVVCAGAASFCQASNLGSGQADWRTYGFTYENTRHSYVHQIDTANVSRLAPVWRYSLGPHERVETTPIVVGRTMYVTSGVGNNVIALDAATGKQKWRYRPTLGFMSLCCGAINRGVAFANGRVFFATLDAQLIALDARSGKPIWNVRVGDPARGFSETMAPLAWNGMVFIGSSGSDYGIRGSFSAYSQANGKLLWRWYAVSTGWEGSYVRSVHGMSLHRNIEREKRNAAKYASAWKKGGGAVWMTPALDPKTGTLFLATSNPAPVFNGSTRPGDNLYTESIVALDARSGKMRWYYQQTPHDVWEYEPTSPAVLFDARDMHGKSVPAVGELGKTRWFYILSRRNGDLIRLSQSAAPNTHIYDNPPNGTPTHPLPLRGTIGPVSYDALRHLVFITAIDRPAPNSWRTFTAAIDVDTGKFVWQTMLSRPELSFFGDRGLNGAASAGDLVFVSDPEGRFFALDAATGRIEWNYIIGANIQADSGAGPFQRFVQHMHDWLSPMKRALMHQPAPNLIAASVDASPVIYEVDGREYVAIGFDAQPDLAVSGAAICAFAIPEPINR